MKKKKTLPDYCLYCQSPTRLVCTILNQTVESPAEQRVVRCKTCQSQFWLELPDYTVGAYFFEYENFRLVFHVQEKGFQLFQIKGPTDSNKLILELDCLPNINPLNVKDKLPTLLTFL